MAPDINRQKRAWSKNSKVDENTAASPSSPSSSSSASSAQNCSLEGFFDLPYELQFRIIELACRSPAPPPPPKPIWEREEDDKVPPVLDTGTTFSLLLGSPDLYALVLPILWRDVMLSRPSALISFREAITSNPQLGLLVVNLHVGPSDELPGWAYPLSERKGFTDPHCSDYSNAYHPATMQITPSVRGNEQPHLNIKHGEGVFSERVWTVGEEHFELDASDHWLAGYQEVVDMLRETQEVIDVDLQNEGYSYDPKTKLASVEYIARVYEAQAVLDLYLIEMARRQVKYGLVLPTKVETKHFACPHLILEGYPKSPDRPREEDEEIFMLTRLDILQHLARPGSVTDRFDSPLLFARSGIDIVKRTPSGGRRKRLDTSDDEREQDWADVFSPSSSIFSGSSVSTISLPSPHSATIGSLLAHLRMVLSSTPNLENLSLTGFLERAICGNRSVARLLPKLRALSLGPPPQRWCAPMIFDQIGQIKELRICGIELLQEEAESIVAKLPVLKTLQWSMPNTPASQSYAPKLKGIVGILVGKSDASSGSAAPPTAGQLEGGGSAVMNLNKDGTDTDTSSRLSSEAELPLIELRLHVDDINALLNEAPSPEVRAAWSSGSPVQGQARRLLLAESKVKSWGRWWQAANVTCGRLYEDGRQWWEDKGGLVRLPVVKAERVLPDF